MKTELIAVSIPRDHPSGTRRRAGFTFTEAPRIAEVTKDQRVLIKADRYLTIHRRLSQAWFTAMGIERTEKNEKAYAEKDPENWKETALVAEMGGAVTPESQGDKKTAPGAKEEGNGKDDSKEGNKKVVNEFSSKADVIKALEEKKLVAGKDFDPDASRDALLAIYRA